MPGGEGRAVTGNGLLSGGRLLRYAVAGGLSALTHVGTLTVLVETGLASPVVASTIGFVLSIVVSYSLQKAWVFSSTAAHRTTLPRFLVATAVGLLLNAAVLALGTEVLSVHYVLVQAVALVLIPLSNYLINSLWTFRHAG
ncbi:GtrA family protein [Ornithinimicrobium cavernae]|uniref:GtrA family protein n=1 Tax=Ornithinimicrobium cavernae TaxID=2666047 RepID=UPI000D68743B|nr:GtrA family protein [Ornithinimicrobium cavernae]